MPGPGEAAPVQPVKASEVNRGVLPKREATASLSSQARELFVSYVRDVPPVGKPAGSVGNIDFDKWRVDVGEFFDSGKREFMDRWEKGFKIDDDPHKWDNRMQEPEERDPDAPETEARLDDVKAELAGGDVDDALEKPKDAHAENAYQLGFMPDNLKLPEASAGNMGEKLRTAEALEELRDAKEDEVPEELVGLRDAARSDTDETAELQEALDSLENRADREDDGVTPASEVAQVTQEKRNLLDRLGLGFLNRLGRRPVNTLRDEVVNNNMTRPVDGETSIAETSADAATLATSVTVVSREEGTEGSVDALTDVQKARVQAAREALFATQMSRINAARKEPGGDDPVRQQEVLQELAKDNHIIVDGDAIRMLSGDHRGFTIDADGSVVLNTQTYEEDGAEKLREAKMAVVEFDGASAEVIKADAQGRAVSERYEEVTDEKLSEIFADATAHPLRIWQEDRDVRVRRSAKDPSEARTLRVVNVGSESEISREKRYFGYPAERTDDTGRLNLYVGAGSELAGRFKIKLYSGQRYRP